MTKKYPVSGAFPDEPSRSHYFSWISSTNEGSTEKQTLANLEYFNWLHREYGMELDIYAWDAGNLDGSRETYGTFESEKFKAQYPHGFQVIADKAAEGGTRLGLWGGPDGFGKTKEDAEKRTELMVSLCRDYHFELFKFDGVCGTLRRNKRKYFCNMMKECRKYSPDLILLNHRLNFGSGNKYATTFLWEGMETYVDVFLYNQVTAFHNRARIFYRGNVPDFKRLTDDHGVCISSSIDYFEDDLIYQAFGRGLILSPSIYGNPWLMRDDEQAKLARIFNLHRQNREILVDALDTKELFGYHSVTRGNGKKRFIVMGNGSWDRKWKMIPLDESIGLEKCDKVKVIIHHPYEKVVGTYRYGEKACVIVMPFRACLVEVAEENSASFAVENCAYEVLHEKKGIPTEIKVIACDGGEVTFGDKKAEIEKFDHCEKEPVYMGTLRTVEIPKNDEALYEATCFAADNDTLEMQSLKRSGETKIPAVKNARDAFFGQTGYVKRGNDSAVLFDGNPESVYDTKSVYYAGSLRVKGGCLRFDAGDIYDVATIEIEYFKVDKECREVKKLKTPKIGSFSADFDCWKEAKLLSNEEIQQCTTDVVVDSVHNIISVPGKRMKAIYSVGGKMRRFRLPKPMDRLYSLKMFDKNGKEIVPASPKVNNLMAPFEEMKTKKAAMGEFAIEKEYENHFIAVAFDTVHGKEGVVCAVECEGKLYGAPKRAPTYQSNVFEHLVSRADKCYTYFIPIEKEMLGKTVKVVGLFNEEPKGYTNYRVYICENHTDREGIVLSSK